MKKVKSIADLKRMALAKGASLEVGTDRFNTTMERVQKSAPEPEVEPTPAPIEAPPAPAPVSEQRVIQPINVQESFSINLDMEPVANAIDAGNERICESITKALKEIQVPVQVVEQPGKAPQQCSWLFTVNRDTRGFIQSVEAKPKL